METHFERADVADINYCRAVYDAIVTTKRENEKLLLVLESEMPGLDIFFSIDDTMPDDHSAKYSQPVELPEGPITLRVITLPGWEAYWAFDYPQSENTGAAEQINRGHRDKTLGWSSTHYKSFRLNTRTASSIGKMAQANNISTAKDIPQMVPSNSWNNAPVVTHQGGDIHLQQYNYPR